MPYYSDPNENTILEKYEFRQNEPRDFVYQTPRQLFLKNFISLNTVYDNVLLFHSLGTGKTCTSITIAEGFKEYLSDMNKRIIVLVKNTNIEKNFKNELLSKCTANSYLDEDDEEENTAAKLIRRVNKSYKFITYGTFVNKVSSNKVQYNFDNCVIIIDEVHNVTNEVYIALEKVLTKSYNYRLVLLTATPVYDNPREILEISNLLNFNDKSKILPIRGDAFKGKNPILIKTKGDNNNKLLKTPAVELTEYGKSLLEKSLIGKVSYLEADSSTQPEKIEMGEFIDKGFMLKIIPCKMSSYQLKLYKIALDLDRTSDDELGRGSAVYKNSNDASTMVYPDNFMGTDGFTKTFNNKGELVSRYEGEFSGEKLKKYSNKMYILLQNLNNHKGSHFIYSNYVNFGGVNLVKNILLNNGFYEYTPGKASDMEKYSNKLFIVYDNSKSITAKENLRKIFNSAENKNGDIIKIIIGSPSVSEGITFKNVRNVHILEPFWNLSRVNQIVGRATRNHSHDDLPQHHRFVKIFKYCSIADDENIFYIDKIKYIHSEEKDIINKKIERLMKEVAFDCQYNNEVNKNKKVKVQENGSPECDYMNCEYKCKSKKIDQDSSLDKDTYKMFLNFFENHDIEYVNGEIRKLFAEYFIWDLDTIIKRINNSFKKFNTGISKEVIYYCLENFIENKIILEDMYERDGFLINKGDYYIFNPSNVDVESSFYTKIINFKKYINKYSSIKDYVNEKLGSDFVKEDIVLEKDSKDKEIITKDIVDYNNKLLSRSGNIVIGSYRKRAIGKELYGEKDDKFRLLDFRNYEEVKDDKRKKITGMDIKSFKKYDLVDIAFSLGIEKSKDALIKKPIQELSEEIKHYLNKNNFVLK